MIFLIDYDTRNGELAGFTSYADTERLAAERARLELELMLSRESAQREVVLLEAEDEQALRATHRRYFANLSELMQDLAADRPRGCASLTVG